MATILKSFTSVAIDVIKNVGIVRLNRPLAMNALNTVMYTELASALEQFDEHPEIRSIILTGSDKVFAAGADIKEFLSLDYPEIYMKNLLANCDRVDRIRTPIIGVVRGPALGGGCELALACDILYAGESAQFGQPEIAIGTIPGGGGTQRLTRAIGKSRAMELILTGKKISAQEAAAWGMVSSVHPDDKVFDVALQTAERIASLSKPTVRLAKYAVNSAYETTLQTGIQCERRVFESTFGTEDKNEGMLAFIEKRKPVWKDR